MDSYLLCWHFLLWENSISSLSMMCTYPCLKSLVVEKNYVVLTDSSLPLVCMGLADWSRASIALKTPKVFFSKFYPCCSVTIQ